MSFEDRLASIDQSNPDACWIWPLKPGRKGYTRSRVNGVYVPSHRAVYEHFRGAIPIGLCIDHICRNRACVNPNHLEPVSAGENVLRGIGRTARQKRQTHCKRGHELAGENLYTWKGMRHCRECGRARQRQHNNAKDPETLREQRAAYWRKYRAEHLPWVRPLPPPNHCYKGHELTPENTFYNSQGHRGCRICRNARQRAWQAERRRRLKTATT